MYKLYINERPLFLCDTTEADKIIHMYPGAQMLKSRYMGQSKFLLQHIDMMEKGQKYDVVIIESLMYDQLKSDFKKLFKIVKAAGGCVQNERNEILFIYRRGFWDLPKGKIDKGESKKEAAVREVHEETGIEQISLKTRIICTNHMYRTRNRKRAIKKSYWYGMSAPNQKLTPQLEEDIERAEWLRIEDVSQRPEPMYKSIKDVLSAYVNTAKT